MSSLPRLRSVSESGLVESPRQLQSSDNDRFRRINLAPMMVWIFANEFPLQAHNGHPRVDHFSQFRWGSDHASKHFHWIPD